MACVKKNVKLCLTSSDMTVQQFATQVLGYSNYAAVSADKNNGYTQLTIAQVEQLLVPE